MLQRVHEYVVDRATKTATITAVRPIRRWNAEGQPTICYQGGQFYDDGGKPMKEEDVPEHIREAVRKNPVVPSKEKAEAVLRFCPICAKAGKDTPVPSNLMEAHLVEHIEEQALAKAGAAPAADEKE